jgi:hypothetical protein
MGFWNVFGRKPRSTLADEPASIVGARNVFITDAESVDDARDYEPLVAQIAAITDGALRFDRATCVEGPPPTDDELDADRGLERDTTRVLTLAQGARTWTGRLQGTTDWVDGDRLLELLNRVLRDLGVAKQLRAIHHPTRWGQELGVVFATATQLDELRAAGYSIEGDPRPTGPEDEVLTTDRTIHGYLFRAGTAVEYWRDPPFDEMEVTIAATHELAGLTLPAGTHILFQEEGEILCCIIAVAHAARGHSFVAGTRIPFEGGAWQLDRAEAGYE